MDGETSDIESRFTKNKIIFGEKFWFTVIDSTSNSRSQIPNDFQVENVQKLFV